MNTKKNTQKNQTNPKKNQKLTNITKSCIFQPIQLKITPIINKYHSNISLAADCESREKSIFCLVKEYPIHLIFDNYFVNLFCYLVGNFVGWLCGWWWGFLLDIYAGFYSSYFYYLSMKIPVAFLSLLYLTVSR